MSPSPFVRWPADPAPGREVRGFVVLPVDLAIESRRYVLRGRTWVVFAREGRTWRLVNTIHVSHVERPALYRRWKDAKAALDAYWRENVEAPRQRARAGGAPKKAPEGLTRVLYVRVEPSMVDALDRVLAYANAGRDVPLSRGDLVRGMLDQAIAQARTRL